MPTIVATILALSLLPTVAFGQGSPQALYAEVHARVFAHEWIADATEVLIRLDTTRDSPMMQVLFRRQGGKWQAKLWVRPLDTRDLLAEFRQAWATRGSLTFEEGVVMAAVRQFEVPVASDGPLAGAINRVAAMRIPFPRQDDPVVTIHSPYSEIEIRSVDLTVRAGVFELGQQTDESENLRGLLDDVRHALLAMLPSLQPAAPRK